MLSLVTLTLAILKPSNTCMLKVPQKESKCFSLVTLLHGDQVQNVILKKNKQLRAKMVKSVLSHLAKVSRIYFHANAYALAGHYWHNCSRRYQQKQKVSFLLVLSFTDF